MRRMAHVAGVVVVMGSAVLLLFGCMGCGDGRQGHEHGAMPEAKPSAMTTPAAAAAMEIAQKTCPVMGGPIKKDMYVDYNGRRIYFCCGACVETFKKDPEKYVAKVDEELKAKPAEKPAAE